MKGRSGCSHEEVAVVGLHLKSIIYCFCALNISCKHSEMLIKY